MKKLNCLAVVSEAAAPLRPRLEALFENVIFLPPCAALPAPVASHPDMLMCSVADKLFSPLMYASENRELLDRIHQLTGVELCVPSVTLKPEYPHDITFNAFNTGKHLYSLTEHTAKDIISEAAACGITPRRVKQGYSACSSLFIDNTVITGDKSISRAAKADGYRVIECDDSEILLPGYDHGFIGGAGGVFQDTVYLFGRNAQIEAALSELRVVTLSDAPLTDLGGIKLLELSKQP